MSIHPFFPAPPVLISAAGRFFVGLMILTFCLPVPARATNHRIEKDMNQDTLIDQIFIYDPNRQIRRVDIDTDFDGTFDTWRFYTDGQLARIETDADGDARVDRIDYLDNEKRTRQTKLDIEGRIIQEALFDDEQRLKCLKKDTTRDGQFDMIYHYDQGYLRSLTRDTNANGTVNVWQSFSNNLPTLQKTDDNEDGIIEKIIDYDANGYPETIRHTPCDAQPFTVFSHYRYGDIQRLERDTNCDGQVDDQTAFFKNTPATQHKDTNFDGRVDQFLTFDPKGMLSLIEEDSAFDGQVDQRRHFKNNIPVKSEFDSDHDGFFETLSVYQNGKLHHQTIDKNSDNKQDITIFFNAREEKTHSEIDTDFNGVPDICQFYDHNRLTRIEKDQNQDKQMDCKAFYKNGKRIRVIQDQDFDGFFETTQILDHKEWSMIIEQDFDRDQVCDLRCFYKKDALICKELDEDSDRNIDIKEFYTRDGRLEKSMEKEGGSDFLNITWLFDHKERPLRAEHDRNQDHQVDTWYYYHDGILTTIEEDTNLDQKPDLWETYDKTESMVLRKKDLDFDGIPDITDHI